MDTRIGDDSTEDTDRTTCATVFALNLTSVFGFSIYYAAFLLVCGKVWLLPWNSGTKKMNGFDLFIHVSGQSGRECIFCSQPCHESQASLAKINWLGLLYSLGSRRTEEANKFSSSPYCQRPLGMLAHVDYSHSSMQDTTQHWTPFTSALTI